MILGGDTRDEEEAKEEHDDETPDVNCNVWLTVCVDCAAMHEVKKKAQKCFSRQKSVKGLVKSNPSIHMYIFE